MKLSHVIFYMKHLFLHFSDRIKPMFYLSKSPLFKMHKLRMYSFMQFTTDTTNPCRVFQGLACCPWEFDRLLSFRIVPTISASIVTRSCTGFQRQGLLGARVLLLLELSSVPQDTAGVGGGEPTCPAAHALMHSQNSVKAVWTRAWTVKTQMDKTSALPWS